MSARKVLLRVYSAFCPKGKLDLLRQILVFCGSYYLYRIVRGITENSALPAFNNAEHVISIEKSLGIFFEPTVAKVVANIDWLSDIFWWLYVNSHFTTTTLTLAFIYMFRNESFYFIRNMFMVAMGIALVGYAVLPTAPPRFFPQYGFVDGISRFAGNGNEGVSLLYNPYAAIPSMHCGFAIMLAYSMFTLAKRKPVRVLWCFYPPLVATTVVVTANHWNVDVILGVLTGAFGWLAAWGLSHVREDWQFFPEKQLVPAPQLDRPIALEQQ